MPRLGAAERRHRLSRDLAYARDRLNACQAGTPGERPGGGESDLQGRVQSLERAVRSRSVDTDVIEEGLDVIAHLIGTATRGCFPSLRDRALLLIAQRHAAERR
jgi:hypothetical protein